MKAISLIPSRKSVTLVDEPEPVIETADQVKVKVLQVGICGTDRDEMQGSHVQTPPGKPSLILGHEMLGQVVEVGSKPSSFKKGDLVTVVVRRACHRSDCTPCQTGHPDLCISGDYLERGIKGIDGFQSQYVVDSQEFVVKLPEGMHTYGVLCEPASVVEKAIDSALLVQSSRLPDWGPPEEGLKGKRVLVAGLGPIGLLAALFLRLHGAEVVGLDLAPDTSLRAKILREVGGKYVNNTAALQKQGIGFDCIFGAVGAAQLSFDLFAFLAPDGIYVLTGVIEPHRSLSVDGGTIMNHLVLQNQIVLGSVNAHKKHWEGAIVNLEKANRVYKGVVEKLITHKVPYQDFEKAFVSSQDDAIKKVIVWSHP
jgi:threonine dehydrogenase-like Zn-dependent dehydrogenase